MAWMPSLVDLPMGLGDHLHDLRRRLIWPLITIGVVFVVAFGFQDRLKRLMVWPLHRAIHIIGLETALKVGLVHTKEEFEHDPTRCLVVLSIAESTSTAVKVSGTAGIALALPVLLWHLWRFVAVGLKAPERRLAFLFVPLGVILFYGGAIIGYLVGLPYFYAWLIEFTNTDTTAIYQLRQSDYIDDFITWTISFGLIMDIPWLVLVLVRTGMVSTATLAKARRYVIVINLVLTCCLCPATDIFSLSAMFIPIQALFEAGLYASRFIKPKPIPPTDTPSA